MLKFISQIQLFVLVFQLIFLAYQGVFKFTYIVSALLIFIVILFQIKSFEYVGSFSNYKIKKSKFNNVLLIIVLCLSIFTFDVFSKVLLPLPLSLLKDVKYLGIGFKLAVVILPASSIVVFFTDLNKYKKVIVFILCIIVSSFVSYKTLSKQPIIPYIIIIGFLGYKKMIPKIFLLAVLFVSFVVLFSVYANRETSVDWLEVIYLLLFRFSMILELSAVLEWLNFNSHLNLFTTNDITFSITSVIFNRDPSLIGLAPSFLGFFNVFFGFLGFFIALLFIRVITVFLKNLGNEKLINAIFYYIWIFEFLSFFTDGIPHFYLSTSNGLFFWGILFTSLYLIKKNKNYG